MSSTAVAGASHTRSARVARSLTRTLRACFWRVCWWLCGGLQRHGGRPDGPAIVVANHRSHADSAALLAALPAGREVVFAAAADYWTSSRTKRVATAVLMPVLPVSRNGSGAYLQLRTAAAPVLQRGGILVLYPEGTRSSTGELGRFKAGAIRLAHDLGMPLVPVAIEGTQHVLPKAGSFRPGPAGVRFGRPLEGAELARLEPVELRDRVSGLLQVTELPAPSRAWLAMSRLLHSWPAPLLAFVWAFAEALSWPLIAELALVVFAAASPRLIRRHALWLIAGSVIGIVVHAWLARLGALLPLPLTTPAMQAAAAGNLADGPWGLAHQGLSGVPVKVYAAQAGWDHLALGQVAAVAVVVRGLRILVVATILRKLAQWLHPVLQRRYGWYLCVVAVLFIAAESRILAYWS